MADSNLTDINKMKVVELRKELKSRGLSYAGDKAELVSRLQEALSHDDNGDLALDSDEIDSDGVLEDEDDKSQTDILDDTATDTINEELALADHSEEKHTIETKPQRTLKRKASNKTSNEKETDNKEGSKKIVLNRSTSVTTTVSKADETKPEITPETDSAKVPSNKIKITSDMDPKTRLEMRAKRFGLPVKVSDADRKEARKQRFNQGTTTTTSTLSSNSLADNLDKLKKRAERFGQSVSSIMTVIENKEKLEKRKEKFGTVK